MTVRDALPTPLPTSTPPSILGTIARRVARLPFAISLATLWLVLMAVIALGADFLLPYSITAFDLKGVFRVRKALGQRHSPLDGRILDHPRNEFICKIWNDNPRNGERFG